MTDVSPSPPELFGAKNLLPALHIELPREEERLAEGDCNVLNVHDSSRYPENGLPTTNALSQYLTDRAHGTLGESQVFGGKNGTPGTIITKTRLAWDGWHYSGGDGKSHAKIAATVFLATTLAINGFLNRNNVVTAAKDVGEEVAELARDARHITAQAGRGIGHTARSAADWVEDGFMSDDPKTPKCNIGGKATLGANSVDCKPEVIKKTTETIKPEQRLIGSTCRTEQDPAITKSYKNEMLFDSGKSIPQTELVNSWAANIKQYTDQGYTAKIELFGSASDDWGNDSSLRVPEQENDNLSKDRTANVSGELAAALKAQSTPAELSTGSYQDILSTDDFKDIKALTEQFGYNSITEAINIYDNLDTRTNLPPSLIAALDLRFGEKRGVTIVATFRKNGETHTICEPVFAEIVKEEPKAGTPDTAPIKDILPIESARPKHENDKNRDYNWRFLPIGLPWLPLPSLRKEQYSEVRGGKPSVSGLKIDDEIEFKIYPEGVMFVDDKRNEAILTPDAWAWTRKMQALIRDDRFKGIISHTYVDSGNVERTLRMLFVDHEPNQEMQNNMTKLLQNLSNIRNGRLPITLDTIIVYPKDYAGIQTSARNTGLGLDEQYDTNVQGLNYSSLGLIEMIALRNPSTKQINDPNEGAIVVATHEVGHSADIYEYAKKLTKDKGLRSKIFKGNRYNSSNSWMEQASDLFSTMTKELQPTIVDKIKDKLRINRIGKKWELEYDQVDNDGNMVTNYEAVDQLPREIRANRVWRVGFPTEYSKTSAGELYAEGFAYALSGIKTRLPFNPKTIPGFAKSARIDKRLHRQLELTTSTKIDANGIATPNNPHAKDGTITVYDLPENNDWYARLKRRSVTTPHPGDENLIAVTTRLRGNNKA